MSITYFQQLPNFEYNSRLPGEESIGDYTTVKNFFRRIKLSDNTFAQTSMFAKFDIVGDQRPDNVAYEVYEDPSLDWLILAANNVLNVYSEWPLTQQDFHNFLMDKYGSHEEIYAVKEYRTQRVTDSLGKIILMEGKVVPQNFSITFYDSGRKTEETRTTITDEYTNYDYEQSLQDDKRSIFIVKPQYLQVIFDEMEDEIPYKEGGTQYVSPTLKRAEDIRLYGSY